MLSWGLVCNEAMQCGTPCVVSPFTGAAGELVIDGVSGFVLDLDVIRWADTISTVLADRAAWAAISDAAVTAVAPYSLERSARKYAEGLNFAARSVRRGQDNQRGRP